MSSPPPPGGVFAFSFSLASVTRHSVVSSRPAMEAAFCRAVRVTFFGSITPAGGPSLRACPPGNEADPASPPPPAAGGLLAGLSSSSPVGTTRALVFLSPLGRRFLLFRFGLFHLGRAQ